MMMLKIAALLLFIGSCYPSNGDGDIDRLSTSPCEQKKNGVYEIFKCSSNFVSCQDGLASTGRCQDGYLFNARMYLCQTPHEEFCSHLISEEAERECIDAISHHESGRLVPDETFEASRLFATFDGRKPTMTDAPASQESVRLVPDETFEASRLFAIFDGRKPAMADALASHHESGRLAPDEIFEASRLFATFDERKPTMANTLASHHESGRFDPAEMAEAAHIFATLDGRNPNKVADIASHWEVDRLVPDLHVEPAHVFEHVKEEGSTMANALASHHESGRFVPSEMVEAVHLFATTLDGRRPTMADTLASHHESGRFNQGLLIEPAHVFATLDGTKPMMADALNSHHESGRLVPDETFEASRHFATLDGRNPSKVADISSHHESGQFVPGQMVEAAHVFAPSKTEELTKFGDVSSHGEVDRLVPDLQIEPAHVFESAKEEGSKISDALGSHHETDRFVPAEMVEAAHVFAPAKTEELTKFGDVSSHGEVDRLVPDLQIEPAHVFESAKEEGSKISDALGSHHETDRFVPAEMVEAAYVFAPAKTEELTKFADVSSHGEVDRVVPDLLVEPSHVFAPAKEEVSRKFSHGGSRRQFGFAPKAHRDSFPAFPVIFPLDVAEGHVPLRDRFDGDALQLPLKNHFAHFAEHRGLKLRDGFDRGSSPELPAHSPFKSSIENHPIHDRFDGAPLLLPLSNPFVHFPERHRPKYQRNVESIEESQEGSGLDNDGDIELFWRRKRSVNDKRCPVKQHSYRPLLGKPLASSDTSSRIRTTDLSTPPPSLRQMFNEAPDAISADPECLGREEGYTFSHGPCRSSFHRCFMGAKVRHNCAQNGQVYSEMSKVCVARADMMECRPPKPPAIGFNHDTTLSNVCSNRTDGLYRHPLSCQRRIQCFDSRAFEYPACSHDLAFDERRAVCDYRQNVPGCETFADNSSKEQPQSMFGCGGHKHGAYIPNKFDCSSFYRCVWDTMELMKCPAGTVFNPKIDVCDYPNQVSCNTSN